MYNVTLRDMYQAGTDTIMVSDALMAKINANIYFDLTQFETVYFDNPYIWKVVKVS